MPGTFAGAIANDTGWGGTEIFLGLTFAMLMMAAISPFIARLLARFGGQRVVFIGSLTIAASCPAMSQADSLIFWYVAWLLAGVGMRLALYDALFAALVNLYGQRARVTISRVTLAGGLASAIFWPLGTALLALMGWRGALVIYSLFGLLSALLLWRMPNQCLPDRGAHQGESAAFPSQPAHRPAVRLAYRFGHLLFLTAHPPICLSLSPATVCR